MARKLILSASLLPLVFAVSCDQPVVKNDPIYWANPQEVNIATTQGFNVPDATEIDLVEHVAEKRAEYRATLEALVKHYQQSADITRRQQAMYELEAFDRMPKYSYLQDGERLPPDLVAGIDDENANRLYDEAMELYKQAGMLLIVIDEDKLRGALNKFNLLISTYRNSNKIDDAAYRAGRIYEYFQDWEIAAVYYQRCFQWNDTTFYPARFRAAYILDKHLLQRTEALTLYQMAVEREKQYTKNMEFAQRRIIDLTKPGSQPGEPVPAGGSTVSGSSVDSFSEALDTMP